AVASHLPAKTDPSAALVAIDPRTGEIRAMVGGPDPTILSNNENLAVPPSRRQTGSSFKVFTLSSAIEQKFNLFSFWNGPSQITLGTQSVSPLEMTRAYATLAANGVRHAATPIDVVKSSDQQVIRGPGHGDRVMAANDAAIVTYALQRVVKYGTGTAANLSSR